MRKVIFLGLIISTLTVSAITPEAKDKKTNQPPKETIDQSLEYLRKLTDQSNNWYFGNENARKAVTGLLHYFEDEKLDTILKRLDYFRQPGLPPLVLRNPEDVPDTLNVPGFIPASNIADQTQRLDRNVRSQVVPESIPIPEQLLNGIEKQVHFVSKENAESLVSKGLVHLPDSLKHLPKKTDNLSPAVKKRILQMDSIRQNLIEKERVKYNDELLRVYIDSVSTAYRQQVLTQLSDSLQHQLRDSLKQVNAKNIRKYNDWVIGLVNDSIQKVLTLLSNEAKKDSTDLWIHNLDNQSAHLWLQNDQTRYARIYIKNQQNDSLGIQIQNLSKNSVKMLIDDMVTFNRMREQQKKDIKLQAFTPGKNLEKFQNRYKVITPWNLGTNTNMGFTQTSLSNWKKGGNSSMSILTVLKGFANYSDDKIKWENSMEIRNGWAHINDAAENSKLQKNDDKFEVISRLGLSAFKKWYYSMEYDFETQFFNGYSYPNTTTAISGFMSPAKTLIKLGLDYKPNKNFSLFLSPLTSKTVFVRDTAKVDQTKFGVAENKRRYWEPGFNADLAWKKEIFKNATYETKYKMFFNYENPFKKVDINWENQISMKLNDYINMNFSLYMLYDDNVTFKTNKIDPVTNAYIYKAKWQIKELITVGFAYKINKSIYKRRSVE